MGLKIELLNTTDRRLAAMVAGLERELGRLARGRKARRLAAGVVLTNDATLAELNRRWRGRDRPTDVLSFPLGHVDPETGRTVLGEVYVSRDRARAQGREYGTGYYGELRRLIAHGLMHLLGLSHREMAGRPGDD